MDGDKGIPLLLEGGNYFREGFHRPGQILTGSGRRMLENDGAVLHFGQDVF
jgi:hypothetical protein